MTDLRDKIADAIENETFTRCGVLMNVDETADAILDLLREGVKPLEWYDSPDDDTDFCADALGLTYVVDCDLDGLCSWGFFRHVGREAYDDSWTIEDAKAAAQADYTRRILSALGLDQ